jgi:cobalt/nickel transport system permease protein
MFLEHALGFSILEALVTALIFAYIQRTDTTLLYGEMSKAQKSRAKNAAPTEM